MSLFCLSFPQRLATSCWLMSLNTPHSFFSQQMIDLQVSSARSSRRNSHRCRVFLYRFRCPEPRITVEEVCGVEQSRPLDTHRSKLMLRFFSRVSLSILNSYPAISPCLRSLTGVKTTFMNDLLEKGSKGIGCFLNQNLQMWKSKLNLRSRAFKCRQ